MSARVSAGLGRDDRPSTASIDHLRSNAQDIKLFEADFLTGDGTFPASKLAYLVVS